MPIENYLVALDQYSAEIGFVHGGRPIGTSVFRYGRRGWSLVQRKPLEHADHYLLAELAGQLEFDLQRAE